GAAARHRASNVRVFSSVARGEDSGSSDIDFLVGFEQGATLSDLAAFEDELAALLRCDVDVLSSGGLKARDEDIRREAVLL
ncbi:MAG: nucleotidyltransferase, partial [Actinomycetota bacterium]|nr:nucleotidyltransferase [Actinomycetota bacterium]